MCGAPLARPGPERRKLVTLLFCDLSGSTAMGERVDAETVRDVVLRYFTTVRQAIERHGGTVEKFAGDAVLAVFGVPAAHEDDALRACRAAADALREMAVLNHDLAERFGVRLGLRIGVNTGEVVAGDPASRETFVSGDAVNVAARLEQNAPVDAILLGELTWRLVRDGVDAEPFGPVAARGKAEPLQAYRLIGLRVPVQRRLLGSALLVGRVSELSQLVRCFDTAVSARRCALATVVGEPGVGKSRLVAELAGRVGDRATVLTGRCLAYGEGITFWPLREVVFTAAQIGDEDSAVDALRKIGTLTGEAVAGRIGALLGLGDASVTPQEVPWTIRRLFEALAAERPLVCVIEDLHWAEPTLLDLIVQLPAAVRGPVLLLCTARPELAEGRTGWPVSVRLEPLSENECHALIRAFGLPDGLRARVLSRAGGNPLFCEQLAALLTEDPSANMPASLSALLTARLDRLPGAERAAAEAGSVEGEVFHAGAVSTLAGRDLRADLTGLMSRALLATATADFAGELAFRFRHVLVRDAAYAGIAKRLRSQLHERFADWLVAKAGERAAEYDEITGYHLEQAHRYRIELAPSDPGAAHLAERAAARLAAAGQRIQASDLLAAVNLLDRARTLLEPGRPQLGPVLLRLGMCLDSLGRYHEEGEALRRSITLARETADARVEHLARIRLAILHTSTDQAAVEEVRNEAEAAIPMFERLGDHSGLAQAYVNLWTYHCWRHARYDTAREFGRRELAHASLAGDRNAEATALSHIAQSALWGTMPVSQAIDTCRECLEQVDENSVRRAWILVALGAGFAMAGRFEEAREAVTEARSHCLEVGYHMYAASMSLEAGIVERLAGAPDQAERLLRDGYETLVLEMGDRGRGMAVIIELACSLCDLGRWKEALDLANTWLPVARGIHLIFLQAVTGRALAHSGDVGNAERLLTSSLTEWAEAEELTQRAEMEFYLAETYDLGHRLPQARQAAERSRDLFRQKGNRVWAARLDSFLASLRTLTCIFRDLDVVP